VTSYNEFGKLDAVCVGVTKLVYLLFLDLRSHSSFIIFDNFQLF